MKGKDWHYRVLFLALLASFFMYNIGKLYGFEMFPDEFGYWSYAAKLSGYDWSNVVSLGSYYSFGYSIILYPIFKLITDSVIAYRMAVGLNFLFLAISFLLLTRLSKKLINTPEKNSIEFYVMIAITYPAWLYYARTTMTETIVMLLYIIICMLTYQYLKEANIRILLALVVANTYIYTVHMRTVGIVIANLIVILIYQGRRICTKDRKNVQRILYGFVIATIMSLVMLLTITQIKKYISVNLYASNEIFVRNDYKGQIDKVKGLFTLQGFYNLLVSINGKVLYLGLASFGLFYHGVAFAVKKVIQQKNLFYFFILLATVGEIAITSIYISGVGSRIDGLTYGRYNEQILPIFMVLGCVAITREKHVWKNTAKLLCMQIPMMGILLYVINQYHVTNMHVYMSLGISYLYDAQHFEPIRFHIEALGMGILLTVLVTAVVYNEYKRCQKWLLLCVVLMQILLAMRLVQTVSGECQLAAFRDVQLADFIQEKQKENIQIVYLKQEEQSYIDSIQFRIRDAKIIIKEDSSQLTQDDFVVTDFNNIKIEELKENYTYWRTMGHLAIFYN